jgi:hypothetical protein
MMRFFAGGVNWYPASWADGRRSLLERTIV